MIIYFDNIDFKYLKTRTKIYHIINYQLNINIFDEIKFIEKKTNEILNSKIVEISFFNSVEEAYESIKLKNIDPRFKSSLKSITNFKSILNEENINQNGILRIKFNM